MDNITQLWIRACKSENSKQRLRSVYRRFYCNIENKEEVDISVANLLIGIVDQYYPMTTSEWCSTVGHSRTRTDKTQSQRSIWLYSTELLATQALRYEVEQEQMQVLASIDKKIKTLQKGSV